MFDPYKVRNDFPMIKNDIKMQGKPLVFFDNASTTFKPNSVIRAILDYYSYLTANSHRGDYDLAYQVDNRINQARIVVSKFINANVDEVVFTSGDTMSLNLIAYGYAMKFLKKDDEIVLSEAEHASNMLPWFKVAEKLGVKIKYVELNHEGRITPENLKKVITSKTKIVALAQIGNVLGYLLDMKEVSRLAHEVGALVVCDGAQSVPHIKTDVKDLDVDFLTFSGHKMLGPTGVGVLYAKKELLDKMDTFLTGGGMNSKFNIRGEVKPLPAPAKFEAGTLNIEGIIGLRAAVDYLTKIGMDNIDKYEKELRAYAISKLKKVPNIIIYNENAESGIITFNIKGVFAQDEGTLLNSKGFALRSGQHCAKALVNYLKTPATVRCSLYFYNTKEEVDALYEALTTGGDFLDAYFA